MKCVRGSPHFSDTLLRTCYNWDTLRIDVSLKRHSRL